MLHLEKNRVPICQMQVEERRRLVLRPCSISANGCDECFLIFHNCSRRMRITSAHGTDFISIEAEGVRRFYQERRGIFGLPKDEYVSLSSDKCREFCHLYANQVVVDAYLPAFARNHELAAVCNIKRLLRVSTSLICIRESVTIVLLFVFKIEI